MRKSSRFVLWFALLLGAAVVLGACGEEEGDGTDGGGGGGTDLATGESPCEEASDCSGDVCVALIDGGNPPVYCSEQCTANSCPSGFYCDDTTFALLPLSFCRYGATAPAQPDPPEEPPTLPCQDDTDCGEGLVCATLDGERGCAVPCTVEDDCTPPAVNGVIIAVGVQGEVGGGTWFGDSDATSPEGEEDAAKVGSANAVGFARAMTEDHMVGWFLNAEMGGRIGPEWLMLGGLGLGGSWIIGDGDPNAMLGMRAYLRWAGIQAGADRGLIATLAIEAHTDFAGAGGFYVIPSVGYAFGLGRGGASSEAP